MEASDEQASLKKTKINRETAKIAWRDLQRFFAGGHCIYVAPDLDLVEVAHQFSQDNAKSVKQWMSQKQLYLVPDALAKDWLEQDLEVWSVVIKPWVLVQAKE